MIFDKLVTIMAEQLGVQPQEISTDTLLRDDLAVDSLDLYNLIMVLEEEFNIEIPEEAAAGIVTVGDALEQIKNAL